MLPPAVEKVQSGSATPVAYERVHCGSTSVESANDGFPIEELFSEEEAKETFTESCFEPVEHLRWSAKITPIVSGASRSARYFRTVSCGEHGGTF